MLVSCGCLYFTAAEICTIPGATALLSNVESRLHCVQCFHRPFHCYRHISTSLQTACRGTHTRAREDNFWASKTWTSKQPWKWLWRRTAAQATTVHSIVKRHSSDSHPVPRTLPTPPRLQEYCCLSRDRCGSHLLSNGHVLDVAIDELVYRVDVAFGVSQALEL